MQWRVKLYEQYSEVDIENLGKSGLAWCEVFALLHFSDFEERESARVRLVAKKIDWREACEEGERAYDSLDYFLIERAREFENSKFYPPESLKSVKSHPAV